MKENDVTFTQLSEKIGISRQALAILANGDSKGVQFKTLEKICLALKCTPNDILKIQTTFLSVSIKEDEPLDNSKIFIVSLHPLDDEGNIEGETIKLRCFVDILNGKYLIRCNNFSGFPLKLDFDSNSDALYSYFANALESEIKELSKEISDKIIMENSPSESIVKEAVFYYDFANSFPLSDVVKAYIFKY